MTIVILLIVVDYSGNLIYCMSYIIISLRNSEIASIVIQK